MEIVILTGMSGAGKTSALNICQDNDYYCIDNIPPTFILNYLEATKKTKNIQNKFAFVIDIRVGSFLDDLLDVVEELEKIGYKVKLIFLDAEDNELIKRYQEKRRPHIYNDLTLEEALHKERKELEKIKLRSGYYIDTTDYKMSELKRKLLDNLGLTTKINFKIISFGFKYGILKEADYIFDVRFIENPFYIKRLKNLTGLDQEVKDFVDKYEATNIFIDKMIELIEFLSPKFSDLGKQSINIGIGCTGGKHRSVVISERINNILNKKYKSEVYHREKKLW